MAAWNFSEIASGSSMPVGVGKASQALDLKGFTSSMPDLFHFPEEGADRLCVGLHCLRQADTRKREKYRLERIHTEHESSRSRSERRFEEMKHRATQSESAVLKHREGY